jgi:hypothetical protein
MLWRAPQLGYAAETGLGVARELGRLPAASGALLRGLVIRRNLSGHREGAETPTRHHLPK